MEKDLRQEVMVAQSARRASVGGCRYGTTQPDAVHGVTGRSPQYDGGQLPCVYLVPIKVNANAASDVVVSCQEL